MAGCIYLALLISSFVIGVYWVRIVSYLNAVSKLLFLSSVGIGILIIGLVVGMYVGRRAEPIPASIGSIVWNFEQPHVAMDIF